MSFSWSRKHAKEKSAQLKNFLANAVRHEQVVGFEQEMNDDLEIFEYAHDDWVYSHERSTGSYPRHGRIMISYLGSVHFVVGYFARTMGRADSEKIDLTLKEALKRPSSGMPLRGPRDFFAENGLSYQNCFNGDVTYIKGKEVVSNEKGSILYEMNYEGGLTNLK